MFIFAEHLDIIAQESDVHCNVKPSTQNTWRIKGYKDVFLETNHYVTFRKHLMTNYRLN